MGILGKEDELQLPFHMNSGNCVKKFKSIVDHQEGCKKSLLVSSRLYTSSMVLLCSPLT